MSESFVSLKNLTLAYGDTVAVPQLTLNIHKGELLNLVLQLHFAFAQMLFR